VKAYSGAVVNARGEIMGYSCLEEGDFNPDAAVSAALLAFRFKKRCSLCGKKAQYALVVNNGDHVVLLCSSCFEKELGEFFD